MSRKCSSWLNAYLSYTQRQESPEAFHVWTAMGILSAIVSENVWIPRIKYSLRPNLYIILVAGSAKCKKSTAVNIGKKLLEGMSTPPLIFAQKITPEALISALSKSTAGKCSYGLLFNTELSVLMNKTALSRDIDSILKDLYDSPFGKWSYHTQSRGEQFLNSPALGMLAATTKMELGNIIPDMSVGGGLTSRIIFVYQDNPRSPYLFNPVNGTGKEIEETKSELSLRRDLIYDLDQIKSEVRGPVQFSKEAKSISEEWYQSELYQVRDERLDGYFARKHDTMFKVASLYSIFENDSRLIEGRHISKALNLFDGLEVKLEGIMDTIFTTQTGSIAEKIFSVIKRKESISHTDLLQKCWRLANAQEVGMIIRTLIEGGEIEEEIEGRKRIYKAKRR